MSIQLSETVRIDTDNAYGNNVSNVDNSSDDTKYSVKMPWLCMLCKMCDVRVSIGLDLCCHSIHCYYCNNFDSDALRGPLWIMLKNLAC